MLELNKELRHKIIKIAILIGIAVGYLKIFLDLYVALIHNPYVLTGQSFCWGSNPWIQNGRMNTDKFCYILYNTLNLRLGDQSHIHDNYLEFYSLIIVFALLFLIVGFAIGVIISKKKNEAQKQ